MSPHFFLNDKTFLVSSKKSNFSIRENLDFNTLFSNNEILQFSRVLKHLKSNLFNDSKVELLQDGYIIGLKLKSNFIGGIVFINSRFNKKDLITALENFKIIFQLILNVNNNGKKLKKINSDLRNKKLEIESFLDISELLSSSSETEILFQNLLEYLVFTMNASKGIILSKDPNSGIYELKAILGIDDSISKKIFRENKGVLSYLKKEKKSSILKYKDDFPLLSYSEKNSLVGPFINNAQLNGAIILYDKESRKGFVDFSQYDLRFFNSIVKKISLSYNNILLLDNVKKSKKLIDNIMSSISTGIIKINLMGEIEYINDSAIEIFNFEDQSLLNNHYAIVFIENPELVELIEFAESRNHVLYEENLNIKKQDQKQTHINLTISPVFDDLTILESY